MTEVNLLENQKIAESKNRPTNKFNYNIESLRGFLAVFVVIHHIIYFKNFLDPNYTPQTLSHFETPGHLSVLIFFILSGYVIGLSNKNNLKSSDIFSYLKKRIVRLYPIYALSLVLTLCITTSKYSDQTIVSHFTFTHILFSDVIWENAPIWSLHYEVIYYLLFIPISFFGINPIVVLISSLTVGFLNYFLFPFTHSALITSYAFGLTFWSVGLVLAKYFKNVSIKTNYTLLLSNLFLILCIYHFNVLSTVLSKAYLFFLSHNFDFPESISWFEKAISFLDLAFLPFCVMFVLIFSEKQFRYRKPLLTILQIIPAFTFIYIYKNRNSGELQNFLVPSIYYLLSLFLYFYNRGWINLFSKKIFANTIWLGSISYALYIVHFPILLFFKSLSFFSGSLFTFITRALIYFTIIISLSYFLERRFQPWAKQKLFS